MHRNKIKYHFGGTQAPLYRLVNKHIVKIIKSDILFHVNDPNEAVTGEWELAIFKNVLHV